MATKWLMGKMRWTKGRFTSQAGRRGTAQDFIPLHSDTQFKTYELFISGILHSILLDRRWPPQKVKLRIRGDDCSLTKALKMYYLIFNKLPLLKTVNYATDWENQGCVISITITNQQGENDNSKSKMNSKFGVFTKLSSLTAEVSNAYQVTANHIPGPTS